MLLLPLLRRLVKIQFLFPQIENNEMTYNTGGGQGHHHHGRRRARRARRRRRFAAVCARANTNANTRGPHTYSIILTSSDDRERV